LGSIYGSQFQKGHFDLFLSAFGIPFVCGTLYMASLVLMTAAGTVVVSRDGDEAKVFQGIGPLGWTRSFRWSEVDRVVEGTSSWGSRRGAPPLRLIELHLKSIERPVVKFGKLLSDERRWFLIAALRSKIVRR
jgi:hypothetical protein